MKESAMTKVHVHSHMRTPKRRTELRDFHPREINDAKKMFFKYGTYPPLQLKLIRREMHSLGWAEFTLDDLLGDVMRVEIGLIDEFGWKQLLETDQIRDRSRAMLKRGFKRWLETRFPDWKWNWSYQRHIYNRLEAMRKSKIPRLMIFIPPRHGKSELITVRYSAWRLEMNPRLRIIIGSHSQRLANRFSRQIRRVHQYSPSGAKDDGASPGRVLNTADEWETPLGGGVKAIGVGTGITGFGADLIINR